MSIQGSQLAPAGEHQERRQASITSIIGDTFLHWRVVSGPTRWSPKKAPRPGTPKSLHSTGIGCKNGPGVATCWGGPPPIPPKPPGRQVLTFETKGSLGRAFVTSFAKPRTQLSTNGTWELADVAKPTAYHYKLVFIRPRRLESNQ